MEKTLGLTDVVYGTSAMKEMVEFLQKPAMPPEFGEALREAEADVTRLSDENPLGLNKLAEMAQQPTYHAPPPQVDDEIIVHTKDGKIFEAKVVAVHPDGTITAEFTS